MTDFTIDIARERGIAGAPLFVPGERYGIRISAAGLRAVAQIVVPPSAAGLVAAQITIDSRCDYADGGNEIRDDRAAIWFDDDQQRELAIVWLRAFHGARCRE